MIKRYVPDLVDQSSRCERNYWRLLKLFPNWQTQDELSILLDHDNKVNFRVVDRFKYTTSLTIDVIQPKLSSVMVDVELQVRMYHDAAMAEVVACVNGKQLNGVYPYPNNRMHHVDEKQQMNHFLEQWLEFCLKFGQIKMEMPINR